MKYSVGRMRADQQNRLGLVDKGEARGPAAMETGLGSLKQ